MKEVVYLFCLARPGTPASVEGPGIDGRHAVFVHQFMNLAAVACLIHPEEFWGSAAESRMKDLSWVGPRACRHEAIVEEVMRRSPVLPLPFGTIFFSLDSLEERLRPHQAAISGFLAKVADKEEWAVRGFLDRTKAVAGLVSLDPSGQEKARGSLPPGHGYFQGKRLRAEAEKGLNSRLEETCRRVSEKLCAHASDFRQRRVPSRISPGSAGQQVLNWAFLISRSGLAAFRATVDKINAEEAWPGLVFELSGPWPPYSFTPSFKEGPET